MLVSTTYNYSDVNTEARQIYELLYLAPGLFHPVFTMVTRAALTIVYRQWLGGSRSISFSAARPQSS